MTHPRESYRYVVESHWDGDDLSWHAHFADDDTIVGKGVSPAEATEALFAAVDAEQPAPPAVGTRQALSADSEDAP